MNRALAFVLLAFSAIAFAQAPQIKSGAAVYIEPGEVGIQEREAAPKSEGGFETYLSAAIMKMDVPLVVVTDKDKAEYIIRSNVQQTEQHSWRTTWTEITASISVMDPRSSQILFAGSATPNYSLKSVAEDCAKQLKQYIIGGAKKHKR
jgi:hypothetical protein